MLEIGALGQLKRTAFCVTAKLISPFTIRKIGNYAVYSDSAVFVIALKLISTLPLMERKRGRKSQRRLGD